MNERIRELKEQAGKLAAEQCNDTVDKFGINLIFQDVFTEKLTELIVKECVVVCSKVETHWSDYNKIDVAMGAKICIDRLEQHFGDE